MPGPQYNAGTDGRVMISSVVFVPGPVSGGGTDLSASPARVAPGVPVATIQKWSKSSTGGGERPPIVTLETPADSHGVMDEQHLRRGGIRKTTFKVESLVDINPAASTPNLIESFKELIIDFVLDKTSTLGYYGCLGTVTDGELSGGDAANGQPKYSFTFRLNGVLPALAVGP